MKNQIILIDPSIGEIEHYQNQGWVITRSFEIDDWGVVEFKKLKSTLKKDLTENEAQQLIKCLGNSLIGWSVNKKQIWTVKYYVK